MIHSTGPSMKSIEAGASGHRSAERFPYLLSLAYQLVRAEGSGVARGGRVVSLGGSLTGQGSILLTLPGMTLKKRDPLHTMRSEAPSKTAASLLLATPPAGGALSLRSTLPQVLYISVFSEWLSIYYMMK